jgi:hypothetical protein
LLNPGAAKPPHPDFLFLPDFTPQSGLPLGWFKLNLFLQVIRQNKGVDGRNESVHDESSARCERKLGQQPSAA